MLPDDPRHGSNAGYAAHYQHNTKPCDACFQAMLAYKRHVYRLRAYNQWVEPYVPAEPIRAHIRTLMAGGVGIRAIAAAAGVPEAAISRILYPRGNRGPTQKVAKENARRILTADYQASVMVSGIGASRRLQALGALGYTSRYLAERLGVVQGGTRRWYGGQHPIFRSNHDMIAALYDELCMIPGPSNSARLRARSKGWVPPLAWVNIDDVNELPADWEYRPERQARRDALVDLDADGATVSEVCRRLKLSKGSLQKWCGNNGMSDLYNRMSERETYDRARNNQYTSGRAA